MNKEHSNQIIDQIAIVLIFSMRNAYNVDQISVYYHFHYHES